jgi:glucokinase
MSNNNTLLCDLGGTHARFARFVKKGEYDHFKKYRLNDFSSFSDIIHKYYQDVHLSFTEVRFAVARAVIDSRIHYKRHAGDPNYEIDFQALSREFEWRNLIHLNDLEAGAHGLNHLDESQTEIVIKATNKPWSDKKILISVGTGIGHSGISGSEILETPGGHWLPITVTEEQRKIETFIRRKKDKNFALIMEDFVSGHGLKAIAEYSSGFPNAQTSPDEFMEDLKTNPDAVRLFFEFLGIHANTITACTGYYGGVYVTGGVIDNLIKHGLTDWPAFEAFYRPNMVQSVEYRLNGCAVFHVTNDELPLLGLTMLN